MKFSAFKRMAQDAGNREDDNTLKIKWLRWEAEVEHYSKTGEADPTYNLTRDVLSSCAETSQEKEV